MNRIYLVIMGVSFGIFLFIAIVYRFAWMMHVDEIVMRAIAQIANTPLTMMFKGFTHLGSYYGTVIVCFIVCVVFFFKGLEREITPLVFIIVITPFVNLFLKFLLQRSRPSIQPLIEISGYSFPSGHTMYATSLYGMILVLLWPYVRHAWKRILLFVVSSVMITMIALSRIYLGVHYPTDIVGGILVSVGLITLTTVMFEFYDSKQPAR